jgi:PAS domain S-box-containing protein
MSPSDPPSCEAARLACLRELFILDTAREPMFDSLVRMASEVCESPIALLSLIDADRQWFKADVGAGGLTETPREFSFCAHAIRSDDLMEVPDMRDDARFEANPFVRDDPGVRFYAGAPLILPCGERVGTLCVLDTQARRLNDAQRRTLVSLADMATQALTMRRELIDRALSVRTDAERALAAREAELHDLYTNAPCGYYSLDEHGVFVRINDTALRWLGCTRDEAIGKLGIRDFLDDAGRQYFHARFPRLKRAGRIADIEYDLMGRNGMTRRVMCSASAVYDAGGRFAMTRTVLHDISELHRTREMLRRLDAEQKSVIDTDLVGIVKVKDRRIVWANRGAEKIFGVPPADLVGMSTRGVYPDEAAYQDFAAAAVPRMAADGMYRSVQQMRHADGGTLAVDTSVSAMPGHPEEWLCVLVDITGIKRAEEIRMHANALEAENRQLLEAARVKRVFLSNMSHELYTPLNAIIGYAHLLGTGAIGVDSPRFAKYLGDIGASGQQLLAQVQSVLSFTDAESGRIELRPERVELGDLLQRVIDVAQAECRTNKVSVTLATEAEPLPLTIDPMRFSQLVSQLLSNAIRFSREGGRVTLRAHTHGAHGFAVQVRDEGIGIAGEDLPQLFTPFRQLSEGLTKTHGGAGLGLALAHRIATALGGTIDVASTPGVGSVFSLTLPRMQGSAAAGDGSGT